MKIKVWAVLGSQSREKNPRTAISMQHFRGFFNFLWAKKNYNSFKDIVRSTLKSNIL